MLFISSFHITTAFKVDNLHQGSQRAESAMFAKLRAKCWGFLLFTGLVTLILGAAVVVSAMSSCSSMNSIICL